MALLPKNNKNEKAKEAPASAGTGLSVCYVEISGIKSSCTLTDPGEIRRFMGLMESYSVQNSLADGATGSVEAEPEAAPEISETHKETMHIAEDQAAYDEENFDRNMSAHETDKGHTITLFMDDGTEITYFLLENMLTDINTGRVTVLSRQQAEEIRAFLEGKVEAQ